MVTRTFHPVGQGGFYTERSPEFNIVFDCGNYRKLNFARKVVQRAFNKDAEIDILFLSHLDWDHISLVEDLNNSVRKIKAVVLPLLSKKEFNLISNMQSLASQGNANTSKSGLVSLYEALRENGTKFFLVKPNKRNSEPGELRRIDTEESQKAFNIVNSGSYFGISGHQHWKLITHNFEAARNLNALITKLHKAKFDVVRLVSDPNYALTNLTTRNQKNKLKKIYQSLKGDINDNSLVLFSGYNPSSGTVSCWHEDPCFQLCWDEAYRYNCICSFTTSEIDLPNRISCVYSGDVDFNKVDIRKVFSHYWDSVGTVQIPHHGSRKSFNKGFLTDSRGYNCVVSCNERKVYGHPNPQVLKLVKKYKGRLFKVTDSSKSRVTQCIWT